jgi:hypothetical protein
MNVLLHAATICAILIGLDWIGLDWIGLDGEVRGSGSSSASAVYEGWATSFVDSSASAAFVSYTISTSRDGVAALLSGTKKDVFAGLCQSNHCIGDSD